MGYIRYIKNTKRVELLNANARLDPKHIKLGSSSKHKNNVLAGCHGEGFKLAALAMSRENYQVRFEANNLYWNFGFRGPEKNRFYATITNSKGLTPPSDSECQKAVKGLTGFSRRHPFDVLVTIGSGPSGTAREVQVDEFQRWLDIIFDVRRPSDPASVIETDHGDLILDPAFSGKLYLKGLLLPNANQAAKNFIQGYNFFYGKVNRDRQRLTDSN
ncbi:hypothetical protein VTN96DRAFT_10303 [Rasamsonia emersonii]